MLAAHMLAAIGRLLTRYRMMIDTTVI